ncbi:hypothetical protein ABTZ78_30455 [Streptomyces bauhiniae]|uniref:hypothetical protein n=1 Tax=Streptomyces bauhiniae TaxID=2340725 RepID=UPI00332DB44E
MGSWFPAVVIVACGLGFVRFRAGRRLVGVIRASATTGLLCCLFGCLQVALTIPAHACPDQLELRPPVHLVRYDSGILPPRVTCYWDCGAQKDFVSGWVTPLALTCAVVLTAALVTALRLFRRHRLDRRVPGGGQAPPCRVPVADA